MKLKFFSLLIFLFSILYTAGSFAATVTITNSGFTFSPDNVTINFGDVIDFQIGSNHNAVEVSEATWQANDNTPLPGGFSVPFGGGQVSFLTAGVHYFVCQPHASLGMKGKITVNAPQGIDDPVANAHNLIIQPNPTNGVFYVRYEAGISGNDHPSPESRVILQVSDYLGREIVKLEGGNIQTSNRINIAEFPDGFYFLRLEDNNEVYTRIIVKRSGC
jgi:plastocyanin